MGYKNDLEKFGKRAKAAPTSYSVRSGDSWFKIAREQLGNERAAGELAKINSGVMNLRPGMVIRLPKPPRPGGPAPFISQSQMAAWRPPAPAPAPAPRVRASPGNLPPGVLARPAGPVGYMAPNVDPWQVPQPSYQPAQQQPAQQNGRGWSFDPVNWLAARNPGLYNLALGMGRALYPQATMTGGLPFAGIAKNQQMPSLPQGWDYARVNAPGGLGLYAAWPNLKQQRDLWWEKYNYMRSNWGK